ARPTESSSWMPLNKDQKSRYKSQLALPGMTEQRQQRLFDSKVVIIGLNAAGSNCAKNLAQSGVGNLTLIDPGVVMPSDLSSHDVFSTEDLNHPKVDVVKRYLERMNPDLKVRSCFYKFDAHNAEKHLEEADLAAEALDNWQDKLLASDCCMH